MAESQRRTQSKSRLPAINYFDGVYFRVLKKYLREGLLDDVDVLVLTKEEGLIPANKLVSYSTGTLGPAGRLDLPNARVRYLRRRNEKYLNRRIRSQNYSEIYVNVGREYMTLMGDIQTSARTTFAQGAGLGPKAQHMKNWILANRAT